jgi:hypothetical protein
VALGWVVGFMWIDFVVDVSPRLSGTFHSCVWLGCVSPCGRCSEVSACSGYDESGFVGDDDELGAVMGSQFGHGAVDVRLGR